MCRLHESGRVVLYLVALALLVGAVTNAVRSQGFLNLGSYGHSSLRHAVRNHAQHSAVPSRGSEAGDGTHVDLMHAA